jgi:FG-GAP-like repeat/Cep192 domain 4/HYDIN/CFA65/VesB-like, Ig-like domain/FG-GAP repeat
MNRFHRFCFLQILAAAGILSLAAASIPQALGQTNPVPLINQPLVPDAVVPGGQGFTLTVNGTGFVSGATVNWNGSPRTTTFVSGSQLTASINAADIAKPGTAALTVTNPEVSETSDIVFFPISSSEPQVNLTRTDYATGTVPGSVAVGDFNGDGKLDLVTADAGIGDISVLLGNGDGTFQPPVNYSSGSSLSDPQIVIAADFNGDGKPDLAVTDYNAGSVAILLGNGDGTFQQFHLYTSGPISAVGLAAGDFNGDGKLDLAVTNAAQNVGNTVSILLGNGDGTFQAPVQYATGLSPSSVAVGDFNGDGKLDLATANSQSYLPSTVSVLLGNGDGTFQPHVDYTTGEAPYTVVAADLNGDGRLDLAVTSQLGGAVSVLLGNGDGSFQTNSDYPTQQYAAGLVIADLNGDGYLDLATGNGGSNNVSLLLGRGDGTFASAVNYAVGAIPLGVAAGDFQDDGLLDIVAASNSGNTVSVLLQSGPLLLSPGGLAFGNQEVGVTSAAQVETLTNTGAQAVNFSSFSFAGVNASDFAQTNTCGTSLSVGASCTVNVTFTPASVGSQTASLEITDDGPGSPQAASLAGTGIAPAVSLSPTSLSFRTQLVGSRSAIQQVTLTNTGTAALSISSVAVSGDFLERNTCGASIGIGANCTISVAFQPKARGTRTGAVNITDNALNSPQTISLTGTGTVVQLSASSVNFGSVQVGKTSLPTTLTLENTAGTSLTIASISLTGANPRDFSETNTCGSSVAAKGTCTITLTFTPSARGSRSASLSISDSGGGSPQTVALSGTGT